MVKQLAVSAISLLVLTILPSKIFGQTSITIPLQSSSPFPVTTTKPISSTSPQVTPITKPVDPNLVDESYCHGFDYKSCPSPRCQLVNSCPVCLDIGTCHAKDYHKWNGKEYEPSLYTRTKTRKIEIKPEDGKKIEITDDKGTIKTVEPEEINEVVISPDPEKCKPKPCTILTLKVEDGKTVIGSDGVIAKTSLPVKIEESKITVSTNEQLVEVLNPSQVKTKIESYNKNQPNTVTITSINLDNCNLEEVGETSCSNTTAIYKIEAVKQNRFLGFIPVSSTISYLLNASTGETISEQLPWYMKAIPLLFK